LDLTVAGDASGFSAARAETESRHTAMTRTGEKKHFMMTAKRYQGRRGMASKMLFNIYI
jgi:hypothetical protein